MERRRLNSTKLRGAGFDEPTKRLEIEFADGSVRVFKGVPTEVWRRLVSAPNPAAFYEDRIAEEYPVERGAAPPKAETRARLDALFGPPPARDD